jgi:hypothetical protein
VRFPSRSRSRHPDCERLSRNPAAPCEPCLTRGVRDTSTVGSPENGPCLRHRGLFKHPRQTSSRVICPNLIDGANGCQSTANDTWLSLMVGTGERFDLPARRQGGGVTGSLGLATGVSAAPASRDKAFLRACRPIISHSGRSRRCRALRIVRRRRDLERGGRRSQQGRAFEGFDHAT